MIYRAMPGEHISDSVSNAIRLASRHNRPVTLHFNDLKIKVNKRLNARHVLSQLNHKQDASAYRYSQSPEARERKRIREIEVTGRQASIAALLEVLPQTKKQSMRWLSLYIPLQDDNKVDGKPNEALDALKRLGFEKGKHVGDEDLASGAAKPEKKAEYIAGQVISMLEEHHCIHPLLADWAQECWEEWAD